MYVISVTIVDPYSRSMLCVFFCANNLMINQEQDTADIARHWSMCSDE